MLVDEKALDSRYKDHRLIGNWANHRECHIEPDWLLIYRIFDNKLYLERTGSHAELFRK
jgi:mRNA interferase YafQ